MNETRRDPREPIELKLRYKSASVDEFAERESGDLSLGGIFIKSDEPLAIGTLLKFEVQLSDETSIISGVGRVVWNRPPEAAGEGAPTGMGIKFVKMDDASRALLEALIEKRGKERGAFDEMPIAPDAEAHEPAPAREAQDEPGEDDATTKFDAQSAPIESDETESRGAGRIVAIASLIAILVAGAYWLLAKPPASSDSKVDTAEKSD